MKNKFILFLLLFVCLVLSGCGSFFEEETLEIASIETETLKDGSTKITINYTDETLKPVEFIVPAGETGETGNGIKDVIITKSEDGERTFIEITYTDEETESTKVELTNGVSVVGVETIDGEDGKKYLVVKYSNNTQSDPIELVSGADGTSFVSVNSFQNPDGSQTIYFYFKKGDELTPAVITIPAPVKGDAGPGIEKVELVPVGDRYKITVTMNDGNELLDIAPTTHEMFFTRPTKWLTGSGIPDNSLGINGDFYYDTTNNDIYLKDGIWDLKVDLDNNGSSLIKVTFDLNDYDSDVKAQMAHTGVTNLTTPTFYEGRKEIPTPTRTGYNFLGWYTKDELSPNATKLEDLTVLTCDITVYAIWEKIGG